MRADDWKWFATGFEWLADFASGWQFGEQGMLVELASRLPASFGHESIAIEIGAGNGKDLPLTLEPFAKAGWHLHAYEANSESRSQLADVLMQYQSFTIHGTFGAEDKLPPKPGVVVIDVDGIDEYLMRQCLENCRPAVLMVEHFDIAGPHVTGMTDFDSSVPKWLCGMPTYKDFRIQSRYQALDRVAERNGYKPVARTRVNSIYLEGTMDV